MLLYYDIVKMYVVPCTKFDDFVQNGARRSSMPGTI